MKKVFLPIALFLLTISLVQGQTISGFKSDKLNEQLKLESEFDQHLSAENIGNTIKTLSAEPHELGSKGSLKNAEQIKQLFIDWGWDAQIETFYVLFPTPKTRVLEMTAPTKYKALLKEMPVEGDSYSAQKGQIDTYNAYGANGDVSGSLVFVNYGLPDDYEILEKMGVDVKGKIVIAKYGHSWRGTKPKVAQEHGAVGCLIYSDPADDGYRQGDVYPKGAFKNEYGVQRGSIMDMVIHPGDPLTPDIGATKDANRLDQTAADNLLKIPVQPISYHDATPLLQALQGEVAPVDWQGSLPFTYHLGEGKTQVRLKVECDWDLVPCYDVIAKIEGAKFPDEWVIRGNHQDAWVNGAADPISGLAAELEEAKAIGELLKTGWKPDRTIIYCAWDGEEPGLLGSTEWVEEHQQELKEKAVLYVNSDGNGRGFLFAQGSHALEPLMDGIAKDVTDPQTGASVFERRKAFDTQNAKTNEAKQKAWGTTTLKLEAMGSGSDYSAFIQHAGIPSLNLGYYGEGRSGDYHTIYDNYLLYSRFKDPGFQYGVALAQTAGRAVLRMAQADVLPFDFTHLYSTIDGYTKELIKLLDKTRETTVTENALVQAGVYKLAEDPSKGYQLPKAKDEVPFLDFSPLQNALSHLKKSADTLQSVYENKLKSNAIDESFNQMLYQAEQQLLNPDGLPNREWYKHVIYAPGFYTGYGVKTMPGIREAIEQREWKLAQEQIIVDAERVNSLTDYFNRFNK